MDRRPPTCDEKVASLLLILWDLKGDPIPFEHAKLMTAYQIVSLAEWHHTTPHSWQPSNHPTVLTPLLIREHLEVTRKQASVLAKVKRHDKPPKWKKVLRSRGFPTKEERERLKKLIKERKQQ